MKILAQTKSFALSVNGNIGISHFEGHENNSGLGSCASIGIRSTNRLGKLSYSTGINYKYIQINPLRKPGGFFPKIFYRIFFVNTLQRGLSPLFDI